MKTIVVPEELTLGEGAGNAAAPVKFGFAQFVVAVLNIDGRFNQDLLGVRSAVKLEALVKGARAGSDLALEDADHELLRAAVERPTHGYPLTPARLAAPFIEAILSAK